MDNLQVQKSHRNTHLRWTTSRSRSQTEILSRDEQPPGPEVSQKNYLEMDNLQVKKSHRNALSRWTTSKFRSPT
ncbi:hypothetical protein DPMN_187775 [Dreissena polymorpha]|uniref:Uncharacterized protein n=1 Tax=Dreissena polymorpha TaxID=45954 RepID=A0A9D4I9D8_DREPO|nr:hypothetical protein DPMN_187775 [Dreissena polymorpha]